MLVFIFFSYKSQFELAECARFRVKYSYDPNPYNYSIKALCEHCSPQCSSLKVINFVKNLDSP